MSKSYPISDSTTMIELLNLAKKRHRKGEVMIIEPKNGKDRYRYFLHVVPIVKPAKSKLKSKGDKE